MAWFGGEANAFIAGSFQHMKGRDKYLTVRRRVVEVRRTDGVPIEMFGTSGNPIPTLRSNDFGYLPTFEVPDLPEGTDFIQVKTEDGDWRRLYRNDRLVDNSGVLAIGIDTDGTPYYVLGGAGGSGALALDTDGVPYFTIGD